MDIPQERVNRFDRSSCLADRPLLATDIESGQPAPTLQDRVNTHILSAWRVARDVGESALQGIENLGLKLADMLGVTAMRYGEYFDYAAQDAREHQQHLIHQSLNVPRKPPCLPSQSAQHDALLPSQISLPVSLSSTQPSSYAYQPNSQIINLQPSLPPFAGINIPPQSQLSPLSTTNIILPHSSSINMGLRSQSPEALLTPKRNYQDSPLGRIDSAFIG